MWIVKKVDNSEYTSKNIKCFMEKHKAEDFANKCTKAIEHYNSYCSTISQYIKEYESKFRLSVVKQKLETLLLLS